MLRVQEIKFCELNIEKRWTLTELKIPGVNTSKVVSFKLGENLNIFKQLLDPNTHTVQIRVYLNFFVERILMCKFNPSIVWLLLKQEFHPVGCWTFWLLV